MSEVLTQARALLQERLTEINTERRQLEKALKELGRSASTAGSQSRAKANGSATGGPPKQRRRKGARRKTSPARTKAVIEYLQANPTASTAEVVETLGLSDGRVVGAQRRRLNAPSA